MSAFCEIINRAKLENREDRDLLGYLQEMNLIAVVVNDDFNEDTVYIPHYIESILNKSSMHVNRELLWLDIRKTEPIWIKDMQYGIESLMNSTIDSNSKQIFRENGLFSTASENDNSDVIEWWRRAKEFARNKMNEKKSINGDLAEMLSLKFEEARVSKIPQHSALLSPKYGYDIESITKSNDLSPWYIEVKSSVVGWQRGKIHLTRNEAEKSLQLIESYSFHLWHLKPNNQHELKIIDVRKMAKHYPNDSNEGAWQEVIIPLSVFSDVSIETGVI
tara:strand:+ start:3866 stop:4693 length:828 start_codon:yes stop_codon:yes gene_type:complete